MLSPGQMGTALSLLTNAKNDLVIALDEMNRIQRIYVALDAAEKAQVGEIVDVSLFLPPKNAIAAALPQIEADIADYVGSQILPD